MGKTALITGITGQDGSYLAEYLLTQGYSVHGLVRRVALESPYAHLARLEPILDRVQLHAASLESFASVFQVLARQRFDECYHLAAQSFVFDSFADGFSTMNVNVSGTHYILEGLRIAQPECRFYFAGSSEMFGKVRETPQKETTPFHPRSPYGISKASGFYLSTNYREAYGMYCANGILFNHESPRRGYEFVTRKISTAVARIRLGQQSQLALGNLEARRDWGHAADYVKAMHLMLQQDEPSDYVVASGKTRSVREFCEAAFSAVGLDYRDYVVVDQRFFRPAEVDCLIGDATKAHTELGWFPEIGFNRLVQEMVERDLAAIEAQPVAEMVAAAGKAV